jgi:FkbM family methyltransferase
VLPEYRSAIGKLIRLPLRAIPHDYVVRVPRGPLKGLRWVTDSSVHGCWLGTYESEKVARLLDDLSESFWDVGANVGFYSLLAASRGCTVVSLEPLPENAATIRKHLQLNQLTADVLQLAASDRNGEASFSAGQNNSTGRLGEGMLKVKTVRLDSLSYPPPQVLKIDVEGAEYEVLLGAEELLRESKAVIYLATHSETLRIKCRNLLLGWGYTMEELAPDEARFSPIHNE